MPFGPKNGCSYFQRFIDETFADEIREGWMIAYIDDVILYYKTSEEHAQHIARVLAKLEKVNMTVSFSKCMVGWHSVKVLGNMVSGLLMAVNGNKVRAIQHIPVPVKITQVQSFLGMCGYYRQYIKDYQSISLPLNKLSRMSEAFELSEARQIAFQELKENSCLLLFYLYLIILKNF